MYFRKNESKLENVLKFEKLLEIANLKIINNSGGHSMKKTKIGFDSY